MHNRTPAKSTGGNYAEAPPEKSKAISQPTDKQRIQKHRRGAGTTLSTTTRDAKFKLTTAQ